MQAAVQQLVDGVVKETRQGVTTKLLGNLLEKYKENWINIGTGGGEVNLGVRERERERERERVSKSHHFPIASLDLVEEVWVVLPGERVHEEVSPWAPACAHGQHAATGLPHVQRKTTLLPRIVLCRQNTYVCA